MNISEQEKKYITAANQTAFMWYPHDDLKRKIIINLSGGTDSAMMLYQLLIYLRERNIFPEKITALTGIDLYRPTNEWHTSEIFLAISEKFKEFNLHYEVFKYYKEDEKRIYHIRQEKEMMKDRGYSVIYHGRTTNPPEEEQKKIEGMWENKSRQEIRESSAKKQFNIRFHAWFNGGLKYNIIPWEFVDKKFIAELYYNDDFMKNEIFPITASCISNNIKDTEYWTKPCKKCWWCKEKKWAFGCYDGGELE